MQESLPCWNIHQFDKTRSWFKFRFSTDGFQKTTPVNSNLPSGLMMWKQRNYDVKMTLRRRFDVIMTFLRHVSAEWFYRCNQLGNLDVDLYKWRNVSIPSRYIIYRCSHSPDYGLWNDKINYLQFSFILVRRGPLSWIQWISLKVSLSLVQVSYIKQLLVTTVYWHICLVPYAGLYICFCATWQVARDIFRRQD